VEHSNTKMAEQVDPSLELTLKNSAKSGGGSFSMFLFSHAVG